MAKHEENRGTELADQRPAHILIVSDGDLFTALGDRKPGGKATPHRSEFLLED